MAKFGNRVYVKAHSRKAPKHSRKAPKKTKSKSRRRKK